jgi:glycosyltransferase involved in cell wall biosynthesis
MNSLFLDSSRHWSGSARAFAAAARAFAARGDSVTVACREGSSTQAGYGQEGLDVTALVLGASVTRDAWRLRAVIKEKSIESVFFHSEREHLVVSSAMRLGGRGTLVRRIPAGGTATSGRSAKLADRMMVSRTLFTTTFDRDRSTLGERAFIAPLGVDTSRVQDVRASSRQLLGVNDATQLIVCVIDHASDARTTTALRTVALLGERHPRLRMIVVGRAADPDHVRMHAAALGITPLVRMLGERVDSPSILAAADLGWVAAGGDDGGFACLDFMAARIPVVAERSALVSHYVPDGITGTLLPTGDPSNTASAVARFMADEGTRQAMGNAGFTRVDRDFRESAMIDGFAAVVGSGSVRPQKAER